jgi:hypothetical protein
MESGRTLWCTAVDCRGPKTGESRGDLTQVRADEKGWPTDDCLSNSCPLLRLAAVEIDEPDEDDRAYFTRPPTLPGPYSEQIAASRPRPPLRPEEVPDDGQLL